MPSTRTMNSPVRSPTGMVRPLYEFIFPPSCFACDGPLRRDEHKVCRSCWSAMLRVSDSDALFMTASARLKREGRIDCLISTFLFEKNGHLQSLIHHLKYNGITDLGIELGKHLGESMRSVVSTTPVAGVIPVPLHAVKIRERGYNQSEYICRWINAVTGLNVCSGLLQRRRYTESQTHLDIEARRRNVEGAFILAPAADVAGLTFVLVDDVITTGATMSACARVLAEHGAARVIASSAAIAE